MTKRAPFSFPSQKVCLLSPNKLASLANNRMLAIIKCKIFYLPVCYPKILRLRSRELILPVVLYGCETGSLTLREEHRLRMFENRVLLSISGP